MLARLCTLGYSLGAFACASSSYAQPVTQAPGLEGIIVTAQRRDETLQDVPASVSVISGETLAKTGARTFEDLAAQVPGLVVTDSVNYGFAPLSIRGIGGANGGGNIFADEPVAVFQDEAYVARLRMSTQDLFDVESIEVLRGPQGVLFGRNATAGALLIHSAAPTDSPEFYVRGSYDTLEAARLATALSGPLDRKGSLTGRLALSLSRREGFGTNDAGDKLNGGNDRRARAFLRYEPDADLRLDLIGEVNRSINRPGTIALSDLSDLRDERTGSQGSNRVFPERPRPDLASVVDSSRFALNSPTFTRVDGRNITARAEIDLGGVKLRSITNYRFWKLVGSQDSDGTAIDPPTPSFVIGEIVNLGDNRARLSDRQFTQEVQLVSSPDGPVEWIAGVFYMHERNRADPVVVNNRLAGVGGGGTSAIFQAGQTLDSFAAYASATLRLLDPLRLSAGARVTQDRKSFTSSLLVRQILAFDPPGDGMVPAGQALLAAPDIAARSRENDISPRFAVEWDADEHLLVYASYTQGFKSGGYNAFRGIQPEFAPEHVDAFELGIKTDPRPWLRVNAAAFHSIYRGMQVRIPVASGGIGIENLERARLFGAELEVMAEPIAGLRLDFGLALLDTKITEGQLSALRDDSFVLGTAPAVTLQDVSGNRLSRAPSLQLNLSAAYAWRLDRFSAEAQVGYRHQSAVSFLETARRSETFRGGAWNQVDLRLAIGDADDAWEVAAFVRNLTNDRHLTQVTAFFGLPNGAINPPRSAGLQFIVRR